MQEELELDLRILEDLAVREAADQKVQTARKEKARADAEWMRQVSASTSQSSGSCCFAVAVLFNISPMMQVPMLFSLSLPQWFHCAFLCVSVRLTCTCVCVCWPSGCG